MSERDRKRMHLANVLFAVVALTLISADPPGKPKKPSTDDPKDLEAIGNLSNSVSLYTSDDSESIYSIKATRSPQKPGIWMKHLKGLKNLTELELPGKFTEDDDLAYLVALPTLRRLQINAGKFSDAGMQWIVAATNLREVSLPRYAGLTSAGMNCLSRLENLERLDLSSSAVADEGLRHLGKLRKLKELILVDTKITDAGLANLAEVASLEVLRFDGTPVTDAGLPHLRALKKLRDISCRDTRVTRNGLVRLNKDLPGLLLPDDPDDVAELLRYYPATTKLDAQGNISEIEPEGWQLQTNPAIGPALRRLHHVRLVSVSSEPDLVVGTVIKNWTELESVTLFRQASDDDLRDLEGLQKLKHLCILSSFVTDEGVKSIARLKNLDNLIIRNAHLTAACMKEIASLPKLKSLDLLGNAVTDQGLKYLKGTNLEFLGLDSTKITDRGIDEIKDMTSLRQLDVWNTKVTKAALEKLKGIRGLEVRGLPRKQIHEVPDDPDDVAAIQAAGISAPKDNVTDNVYDVDADGTRQEPRGWMKHLKGLHNLKRLKLPDQTSDDDLQYLVGLTSLRALAVRGPSSDDGMNVISRLTNLRELSCGSGGITSATAKHLAPLVNLEWLDLTNDPIGDEGLRYLAGMKRLKKLGLIGTKITDAGLVHLQGLSALEEINLMHTGVTDAGLQNLRGLKNLTSIWGAGSRESQIRLKKDLPNLVVPREPPSNVFAP